MTNAATERSVWPALLVLLVACEDPGALTGVPEFEAVRSAVWLDDEAGEHLLMLSDQAAGCEAVQAAARLIAALDVNERDDCEAYQAAAAEIGVAYGALLDAGAATLLVRIPEAPEGRPEEGSYATADADGEDVGPLFEASVLLFQGNPWDWAATEYTCGDPDPVAWYVEELVETLGLGSATLDVSSVSAGSLDLHLEGQLTRDAAGDLEEAGALTADAHLRRCRVETVSDPILDAL